MLYNKYGSVSPKKRFILLCLPLAAAIICTACNNAYAVNISDGGISYDNTYSQTESTSADTDKTTSQTKEEEPLPVPEPEPKPDCTTQHCGMDHTPVPYNIGQFKHRCACSPLQQAA